MHSRLFNGSSEQINCYIGNMNFIWGPGTYAAIVKSAANLTYKNILTIGDGNRGSEFHIDNGNWISVDIEGNTMFNTVALTVADGWCLVAITKAAGTVFPRGHKYVFSTSTWTHNSSNGTLASGNTMSAATARVVIGSQRSIVDVFNGNILMVAAWDRVLDDTELETMTTNLDSWIRTYPRGLWVLNQSSASTQVKDITGGGANEYAKAGTTVSTDVPSQFPIYGVPFNYKRITAV